MSGDDLVIVPAPPLAMLLTFEEQRKGSALTEREVWAIRDRAVCMAMPPEDAARLAAGRGYDDVRLDHAWDDWNAVRTPV